MLGDLEIVRIPLILYRARNATSRKWRGAAFSDHPFASTPVFLAGNSAIGSPYFQSISLGFECAMFLAGLIAQRELPLRDVLDRYELHIYKQWLRVYMRSKMIKHNKDLFETVDDKLALLGKLRIYSFPSGSIGGERADQRQHRGAGLAVVDRGEGIVQGGELVAPHAAVRRRVGRRSSP